MSWLLQPSGDVLVWPGLAQIGVELLVDGVWRRPSACERVATNKLGERVIVAQPEMHFRFQVTNTSEPSGYGTSRYLLVQARPDGLAQPVFNISECVAPGQSTTLAGFYLSSSDLKNVKPFSFGLIQEGAVKSSAAGPSGGMGIPDNLGKLIVFVEEARLVPCAPKMVKHEASAIRPDEPLQAGPKAQLKIGCHVPGLSAAEAAAAAASAAHAMGSVRTSEYAGRITLPQAVFRYKDEAALLLAGEIASLPLAGSGAMKHDPAASSSSASSAGYSSGKAMKPDPGAGGAMKPDPGAGGAMKPDPGAASGGAGVGGKRSASSAGFGGAGSGTVYLDGVGFGGSKAASQPHDGSVAVLRIADDDDDGAAAGGAKGASKRPRQSKSSSAVSETITRPVKVVLSGGQQAGIREMLVPVLPAGGTAALGFKCDADGALELLDDDEVAAAGAGSSSSSAGASAGAASSLPEPAPWYQLDHFFVGAKSAIAAEKHESRMQSFDAARAYATRLAGGGVQQAGRAWTIEGEPLASVAAVLEYTSKNALPVVVAFSAAAAFKPLADLATLL